MKGQLTVLDIDCVEALRATKTVLAQVLRGHADLATSAVFQKHASPQNDMGWWDTDAEMIIEIIDASFIQTKTTEPEPHLQRWFSWHEMSKRWYRIIPTSSECYFRWNGECWELKRIMVTIRQRKVTKQYVYAPKGRCTFGEPLVLKAH